MQVHFPRARIFWVVSFGHFINDTIHSMGPVALAFLAATVLPMTNAQIGLAVSAAQLLGAVSQPFFGIRVDRSGGRWLGTVSLLWGTGMFMLAIFIATQTRQYWLMFVPFVLGTLGSGAIHPIGALYAAESERDFVASNTSIFFLLGQFGLALGPAVAGYLLDIANPNIFNYSHEILGYQPLSVNITPLLLFGLLALPGTLLIAFTIPTQTRYLHARNLPKTSALPSPSSSLMVLPFVILIFMVALRSLSQPGSVTFIPLLFQEKGWTPAQYGLITSSFWIASGISGVIFGQLADRFDRRYIMMWSMVLSAPAFFFLPITNGAIAFLLAIIAGGLSGGGHSIIVVLAQELIPASKGFASGAILGLIFGLGAVSTFIIGTLSDIINLGATFQIIAVGGFISGIMALLLPRAQRREVNVDATQPAA